MQTHRVEISGGVARVTLNRPEKHNCFDESLIAGLTATFLELGKDEDVRVIVLAAEGKSFSAGGDLNWMKRASTLSEKENIADALRLGDMLKALDECPKPTLALAQGPAIGGGVGLICACDIAVMVDSGFLQMPETRLGIVPGVVGPFVVRAMGARQARRWELTAERLPAVKAAQLGILHEAVPADNLEETGGAITKALLGGGPASLAGTKEMIRFVDRTITGEIMQGAAQRIARARSGEEGREGVAAFLEKRKPSWTAG